jgi:superfamily II DNA or RNA helicase
MNIKNFSDLKLPDAMLKNLIELEYHSMTPVQADALPEILQNRDVIVQAKTGSGKTAAFGIGVLNKLDVKNFKIQSMIICPTRELADQVAKELRRLARFTHNIKILMLYGGTPFKRQVNSRYFSLLCQTHANSVPILFDEKRPLLCYFRTHVCDFAHRLTTPYKAARFCISALAERVHVFGTDTLSSKRMLGVEFSGRRTTDIVNS